MEESRHRIRLLKTEQLHKAKEFITGILEYKAVTKLHGTYVEGVKKALENTKNGKIYYSLKLDGTVSGRSSCTKYDNLGVSFHTLARKSKYANIRNEFVAPLGHVFITSDYKGMELRIVAHLANDERMIQAFIEGKDLHTFSASLLFDRPEDKVTKEQRQTAKAVSFLIVYGGQAFNLSQMQGIPVSRAEKIIEKYQRLFPSIFSFMSEVHDTILENRSCETLFGRIRHLENASARDRKVVNRCLRQGFNNLVQSPANEITGFAVLDTSIEFELQNLSARNVCTVHDSIETVCKFKDVKKTVSVIYDKMVNYPLMKAAFGINLQVPLDIDMEIGPSFGEALPVKFFNGEIINLDEVMEQFND